MLAAPLTGFGVDVGGETSFPGGSLSNTTPGDDDAASHYHVNLMTLVRIRVFSSLP